MNRITIGNSKNRISAKDMRPGTFGVLDNGNMIYRTLLGFANLNDPGESTPNMSESNYGPTVVVVPPNTDINITTTS